MPRRNRPQTEGAMGQHGEKTAGAGEISVARRSAIASCDNTVCHTRPSANALDFVRSAGNGFLSMTRPCAPAWSYRCGSADRTSSSTEYGEIRMSCPQTALEPRCDGLMRLSEPAGRRRSIFSAMEFSVVPQKNRGSTSARSLREFRQSGQVISAGRRRVRAERAPSSLFSIHRTAGGANDGQDFRSRTPANGFSFFYTAEKPEKYITRDRNRRF
jgi:hypothetical protein